MCLAFYWCWFPCHDNLESNKNDYSEYCLGKLWLVNIAKEIPEVYNTTNNAVAGCSEYSISVCKVQIKWWITYSPHKCSYNNLRKLFQTVFLKDCLSTLDLFPHLRGLPLVVAHSHSSLNWLSGSMHSIDCLSCSHIFYVTHLSD